VAQDDADVVGVAVATRDEEQRDHAGLEPLLTPLNFRLNLGARLADVAGPLPDLDNPAIRKLTWEHVVPERAGRAATELPAAALLVTGPLAVRLATPLLSPPVVPVPVAEVAPAPVAAVAPAPASDFPVPQVPSATSVRAVTHVPPAAAVPVASAPVASVSAIAPEPTPAIDEVVEPVVAVEGEVEPVVVEVVEPAAEVVEAESEAVAEVAPPVVEAESVEPPAVAPVAVVRQVVPAPEVNKLSAVPDLIEDDSPIELPRITPSGPVVIHSQSIYAPVLSDVNYAPQLSPVTTGPAVARAAGADDNAGQKVRGTKRSTPAKPIARPPKRHFIRSFLTMVVLFGLLAGGAFTAKKYLLNQPKWSAELKPLADDVATARGVEFTSAVEVAELPVAQYATQLAAATLGPHAVEQAPAWRALGLLGGELDLDTVGRQAMNDSPAFYDPTAKTIYVVADLSAQPHLYRFAMHRAMMAALLDQKFDWSSRAAAASPAAAFALRSTIDGDALAVANTLAGRDGPEQLAPELFAFAQAHATAAAAAPYAVTLAGRIGAAMQPAMAALGSDVTALATAEQTSPTSDALLDLGRPSSAAVAPGAQGMMFWYYVLASRVDDTLAWSAITHWSGDSMAVSTGSTNQCVDAKVDAADADGAARLLDAFSLWAAAAPAESTATVVPIDGNQVAIRACDPGAAIAAQQPARVPVVFGATAVERALVQSADTAAGGKVDAACLVTAARQRGAVIASPGDDAPVISIGWAPAYVAANIDLAAGCVAPAG
jgi:hypothetical protein